MHRTVIRFLLLILGLSLVCLSVFARQTRSHQAIAEFKRQQPCPATGQARGACPGWVIDHITALACGGPDKPANMQWQTTADAKAKDKWELKGCRSGKP